jgi:Survival motor neuron (SMN) interacting protein 1 (SIP1)
MANSISNAVRRDQRGEEFGDLKPLKCKNLYALTLLQSFSQLSKLPNNEIKLPAAKDKKQWKEFLYGAPKTEESGDQGEGHSPDVNILQRISQVHTVNV